MILLKYLCIVYCSISSWLAILTLVIHYLSIWMSLLFLCYLFMICAFLSTIACISMFSWNPLKTLDLILNALLAWYLLNSLLKTTSLFRQRINFSYMFPALLTLKYCSFLTSNRLHRVTLRQSRINYLHFLTLIASIFVWSLSLAALVTSYIFENKRVSLCCLMTLFTLSLTFYTSYLSLKAHASSWLRSSRCL